MKKKLTYCDVAAFFIVLFTLAAHDKSLLFACVQVICSLILFYTYIIKNFKKKKDYRYFIWQAIFITLESISLVWSINTHDAFIAIRSTIQTAVVGFAIILYINSSARCIQILKYVVFAASALVLRLLVQVPREAWGTDRVGNYIGYGNNGAANILAYAAVISSFLYLYNREKKKSSFIYIIITLVLTAVSFLCGSKKAIAIVFFGVGIQVILSSKSTWSFLRKVLFVVFATSGVVYLVMETPYLYNVLGRRVERMFYAFSGYNDGDGSTRDRIELTKYAYEVFKQNPIMGVGIDNFRHYNRIGYYAHNNYAEVAADLGIIGFLWYYGFFILMYLDSIRCRKGIQLNFILVFITTILMLDVGNVSYNLDSIQLYLAIVYGMLVQYKLIYRKRV